MAGGENYDWGAPPEKGGAVFPQPKALPKGKLEEELSAHSNQEDSSQLEGSKPTATEEAKPDPAN